MIMMMMMMSMSLGTDQHHCKYRAFFRNIQIDDIQENTDEITCILENVIVVLSDS